MQATEATEATEATALASALEHIEAAQAEESRIELWPLQRGGEPVSGLELCSSGGSSRQLEPMEAQVSAVEAIEALESDIALCTSASASAV